jgi:hypothetical protein
MDPIRDNESALVASCVQLSESIGRGDTTAVLSDLLSLQRQIEKDTSRLPPSEASASTSRSNERDFILQALRLNLDNLAESIYTSIDRAEAIIDMSRSFIPSPHGGATPHEEVHRSLPSVESILAYAHRLRYTTFAHAGLVSLPPAPQPAQMLNSTLFRHSIARAADARPSCAATTSANHPDASQASAAAMPTVTSAASVSSAAAASISGISSLVDLELPPMPDGWKPGDPLPSFPSGFQLPEGIPEMPEDWRPGDPLPGLDRALNASTIRSTAMELDDVRG